ncbi:MAG: nucleoside deaminase [Ruminococcaceae bacterium]|nr:nucleoside deaminase [Oscillospiraceae bacterium]
MTRDEFFMSAALKEAQKAALEGEVPIGCVIVKDDKIIARGRNAREKKKNALLHAETVAIDKACKKLAGWRLWQCDLYVTLEPCPMCCGAIINSRIKRVVIAAMDPKAGAMGSVVDLTSLPFNHKPEITTGILEEQSQSLLKNFFKNLRQQKQRTE